MPDRHHALPLCRYSKAGPSTAAAYGRCRGCPLTLRRGDAPRCPCKQLVVIDRINAGKTPVTAAFCLFPNLRDGGTIENPFVFSIYLKRELHPDH